MSELLLLPFARLDLSDPRLLPIYVALFIAGWLCWKVAQDEEPPHEDSRHSGAPDDPDAAP